MAQERQITALLQKAALLRAGGATWAKVAKECHRQEKTCRDWPRNFPDEWAAAYEAARAEVIEDAHAEALIVMRGLLRSDAEAIKQRAAHSVLHHATANRPQKVDVRMVVEQATDKLEEAAREVGLTEEQIDVLLEKVGERL